MKKSIKLYFSALKLSFILSFKASSFIMIFRLLTLIAGAVIPVLNAHAMKNIIDSVVLYTPIVSIKWLIVLGACQVSSAIIGRVTNYLSVIHTDRISLLISRDIATKVNELDISYFDNPKLYDELKQVTSDIKSIPSLIWQVLSSLQMIVKTISAIVILSKYIPISPWVLILSCLPILVIDKHYAFKMYEWNRSATSESRKMNYSYDTLTSKYFSKDIRLHSLQPFMFDKYERQWNSWHKEKYSILTKQFWASFTTMFLPNIATLVFATIILIAIIDGKLSVGDFSYFISIMGQLTASVSGLISIIAEIIKQKVKIEYYYSFNAWESNIDNGTLKIDNFQELVFDNVSFTYPNTKKQVLSNVSFSIKKGEKMGIVGKNGCGKTTIIKLILRLYKPTSGKILLNEKNIEEYDIESYYRLISSFMQEYVNYCFTLDENIRTADLGKKATHTDVIDACKKSDIYSFVSTWENGVNEFLTKSFDATGKELSGGQWQKISLSRFFFRESEVKIMDEPSSSLDIEAERKILYNVINSDANNTVVLISHRLINMKNMDKIIVIDNGRLIESGTHDELICQKGLYYHLFDIQKRDFL